MKTILVTGGANGIGKGIALHYLQKGDYVIAVGSSASRGELFIDAAAQIGAADRAYFLLADLSSMKENRRIIGEIQERFNTLDALVFCASKHGNAYIETSEGIEFSFALDYLSRFLLSYGLKKRLENSENPVIMSVCGAGMKGAVDWDDLQHKSKFVPMKVMMHGSRLNELSALAFAQNDKIQKIKYILYNPMAVQTPGMMKTGNAIMRMYYKLMAKPIAKAVLPIAALLDAPPDSPVSIFKEYKKASIAFKKEDAQRLYDVTTMLLEEISNSPSATPTRR